MGEKMTISAAILLAEPHRMMRGDSGRYPDGTCWGSSSSTDGFWLPLDAWQAITAHLTQPVQAVDVDEPQVFQDLRYWMKHCVSACDEGEDFSLTRDDLIALTTLGLMEKAGRGKWRPTDKGRALAALPNVNGKEGCPHEWEQVTTSGGVMDRCSACGKHRWHDARGAQ